MSEQAVFEPALSTHPVALVDILDRVLGKGVVVSGEIVVGIADVDLIRISLRALLASVRAGMADPVAPCGPAAVDGRPS